MIRTTQDFAQSMQYKINARQGKYGDFCNYQRKDFIAHLELEISELRKSDYSLKECIDVANLCYMIWATD